ncbi:MAG TPA: hypothetical protein VN625_03785 [Desulfuromonadaceae bacterium]|nr:hypothetical protein [Desulfuromonadaceae bacterium]
MGFVDFILNLAGLLMWLNWRAEMVDPVTRRKPATLVGTLRRADKRANWWLPSLIGGLLVLRALLYWQIGAAVHWVGNLDAGITTLFFRPDLFTRMLLYSACSFGLTLGFFYLALLLLSLLEGPEPFRTFVRQQLGAPDRWARLTRLFFPLVAVSLLWWALSWLFTWLEIVPSPTAEWRRVVEAVLVGLGSYLAWKYVAIALLGLHLLNNYIYFGKHPFWNFINAEAASLLAPLRKLPLRIKRIDLTPLAGIAVVWGAAYGMRFVLELLYKKLV